MAPTPSNNKKIGGIDVSAIDAHLKTIDPVVNMSKQLNVPELYLGLGGGAIAALMLYAMFGGAAIANLVGFVPPAYLSFRALSVSGQDAEDKQWLAYWLVFASVVVLENFFYIDFMIGHFYPAIKIAFYGFCMHDHGALHLFRAALLPPLHAAKVDPSIEAAKKIGVEAAKSE